MKSRCTPTLHSLIVRGTRNRGVALILVTFVVALAMVVVSSLAYSTHLAGRRNSMVEKSFQAEYLLKSAVNLARVLIKLDQSTEDSEKDYWGIFKDGMIIPPELLDIGEPNIRVEMEIRPEEAKIPLRSLVPTTNNVSTAWRDVLVRLFEQLGFDADEEEDETGLFPGKVFGPEEMVANLIDYVDADKVPYTDTNFQGVEGSATEDFFPNEQISRFGQLASVPGFTTRRLARLQLFLTTYVKAGSVNVNVAPRVVLKSLDPGIDDSVAENIIAYVKGQGGPMKGASDLTNGAGLSSTISNGLVTQSLIRFDSRWYQVIAKVSYGEASFFIRSYLEQKQKGDFPDIASQELY